MIERKGDIFTTEAGYIGHGVNTYGLMGAGIARQFRATFGEDYFTSYVRDCKHFGTLVAGHYSAYETKLHGFPVMVLNLASQNAPGASARYEWLFSSLLRGATYASAPARMSTYGGTIAIPEIGCGIGGLVFSKAKKVIEAVEYIVPAIEFEVWHYGR